jgi:dTDP-glucose 4,6-dehydratase
MRIVVTGGAGFIGSAVVRMLVAERAATVLNLDKLTAASSLASLKTVAPSPRYTFRKTDVCDRERVFALLQAFSPDAIVHAAFDRQTGAAGTELEAAFSTNVLGTWRMLEAARDYWSALPASRQSRFRFISVSRAASDTVAAASRAGADELVTAWHRSYGLPVIVSKAAATFGPYQFPDHPVPAAVIGAIDRTDASAEPSSAAHDWLFVEDHARALIAMLDKGTPGATYALAGRGRVSPAAMAGRIRHLVARQAGRPAPVKADDEHQPVVVAEAGALTARLAHDTGWRPEETAETALSRTVRWYLANETWWRPLVAAADADAGLGILRIA